MTIHNKICLLINILIIFFAPNLLATVYGSDSTPSRQGAASFLASDNDNEMNGFGAFEGGFTLENSSTTCTFDSFFPVSGSVSMNGGSLHLSKNLIFDTGTTLNNVGNICGYGYDVDLAETITSLDWSSSVSFYELNVYLHDDMSWKVSTTIKGECLIDGGNNIITIEGIGDIVLDSGATLTVENAELRGLTSQTFKCNSDDGSIVLQNCTIRLDNDFTFDTGSLLFKSDVIFTGTNAFIYSSKMASTIYSESKLLFDQDATFKYAPSIANRDLLYMADETSILCLDGSVLHSTPTGIRLTRGTLHLDNLVTLSAEGDVAAEAICFGDGTASNDLTIKALSDCYVICYGEIYSDNVN